MKAIVAVDKFWGIGKNNDLLFDIPEDMRFFRAETLNKVIVMGSNTLFSFPGGKPLKNRVNIVLYPGGEKRDDCIVCDSIEELKEELKKYPAGDIYIVGGAMFYKTMLKYCSSVLVTKVNADGKATHFFENLDELENWTLSSIGKSFETGGYEISFNEYINSSVETF